MKGRLQALPIVGEWLQKLDIRREQVWGLWTELEDEYRTRVVAKEDAAEMRIAAVTLSRLGIADTETFLKNSATTIGRRIYVPFDVGVPKAGWDLWTQVVVCAHEHQHVVQRDREGVMYDLSYVVDPAARARLETECFVSDLELTFWRYGRLPKVEQYLDRMAMYALREVDLRVAMKSLEIAAVAVRQGAVVNQASKSAIAWLDANVPHLRARKAK